jgi:tetratricopeptide (TPR) repeat protein
LKSFRIALLLALLGASLAWGQAPAGAGQTLVILPFENASKAPGLEWIGESFPEIMGQRLASSTGLYVVPRQDRVYALDRLGVPTTARPSLATRIRLGEEMDVDYIVVGEYTYDGQTFSASAQLLDMKQLHLSAAVRESGPLPKLLDIQLALTWDVLRLMTPNQVVSRNTFVAAAPAVRLDALEKYIRGVIASEPEERMRNLRDAVRLNPEYVPALLALGHTYYDKRDYKNAAGWFDKVPAADPAGREAQFYLGMSAFYLGDFPRAQSAFAFVVARLPLGEVYNNLGVVAERRGAKNAAEFFQRAADADPTDADYHFNLAVALYKSGDAAAAAKQLKEEVALKPGDGEAKSFLDAISRNQAVAKPPLERIKPNYDEASFRQLALEVENVNEARMAKTDARTHANFHVQHGRQMLAQNLLLVAESDFREAVQLDPSNAAAHAGLARVFEIGGDKPAARAALATSLRLQPNPEAFLVLARLDLNDNKPEAAGESVDKVLQLEPTNAAAQALKIVIAAKLAEKAQPLRKP